MKHLSLPMFSRNRIAIKISRLFFTAKIYQDGKAIKKTQGKYLLEDDTGKVLSLTLKRDFLDPIPKIELESGEKIQFYSTLTPFEKALALLPLLLFFVGGVNIITLLFSLIGVNLSYWVMYKNHDIIKKVLLALLMTLMTSSACIYVELWLLSLLRS